MKATAYKICIISSCLGFIFLAFCCSFYMAVGMFFGYAFEGEDIPQHRKGNTKGSSIESLCLV